MNASASGLASDCDCEPKKSKKRRDGDAEELAGGWDSECEVLRGSTGEFQTENHPREIVPGIPKRSVVQSEDAGEHAGSSDDERRAGSTKRGGGACEQTDGWNSDRKAIIVKEGGLVPRGNRSRGQDLKRGR